MPRQVSTGEARRSVTQRYTTHICLGEKKHLVGDEEAVQVKVKRLAERPTCREVVTAESGVAPSQSGHLLQRRTSLPKINRHPDHFCVS